MIAISTIQCERERIRKDDRYMHREKKRENMTVTTFNFLVKCHI